MPPVQHPIPLNTRLETMVNMHSNKEQKNFPDFMNPTSAGGGLSLSDDQDSVSLTDAQRASGVSGLSGYRPRRSTLEVHHQLRRSSVLPSSTSAPQLANWPSNRHSSGGSSGIRGISIVPRRISGVIGNDSIDVNLLRKVYVASRPPAPISDELGQVVETSFQCTVRLVRDHCSKNDYDEVESLLKKRTKTFMQTIRTSKGYLGSADDLSESRTIEEGGSERADRGVETSVTSNPRKASWGKPASAKLGLPLSSQRRYLSDWLDSSQFIEWLIEFLFVLWYSSVSVSPEDGEPAISYIAIRQVCKQIVWSCKMNTGESKQHKTMFMTQCYKSVFKMLPWQLRMRLGNEGPKGETRWSDVSYDPFDRTLSNSKFKHSPHKFLHWFTREFENPYIEKSFQVDLANSLMQTPYWPFFATVLLALTYIVVMYGFLHNEYPSLTFVRLLITEPVSWLMVAAVIQLVTVTVLFANSQTFKENYFSYQFVLGLVICCIAAVWMYEVRNIFAFIAWPISEGFTMAFILISVSACLYIRFVDLVWLCIFTAIFTVCMRVSICGSGPDFNANCGMVTHSTYSLPLQQTLAIVGALLIVLSGRYLFETHSRLDFFIYRTLYRESERSDKLLLSILPAHVIQHLKASSSPSSLEGGAALMMQRSSSSTINPMGIAQAYDKVSILFTDVVSFTTFSSFITPEELVLFLNELFTQFDDIAEETGLEKIKTIGDAYLCISGLPNPDPLHAVAAAKMGLKIAQLMQSGIFRDHNLHPLGCRVGIHSGSVVAGVIGRKKFIYDIWGDAVNTASRMESTGEPNRVHVSEDTAELIREQGLPGEFLLTCRGEIAIKGKGTMKTFWVQQGDGGGDRFAQHSTAQVNTNPVPMFPSIDELN